MTPKAEIDAVLPKATTPKPKPTAEAKRTKFTPGPWSVTEDGTLSAHHFVVTTNEHNDDFTEREDVAEVSLPSWSMPSGLRGKRDTSRRAEAEANARLIAQAPAMYALLRQVAARDDRGDRDEARRILAAIDGEG